MAENGLPEQINEFIREVDEWRALKRIETSYGELVDRVQSEDMSQFAKDLLEKQRQTNTQGAVVRELAEPLATEMTDNGFDCENVVRVLVSTQMGGGGPYNVEDWQERKTALMKLAIELRSFDLSGQQTGQQKKSRDKLPENPAVVRLINALNDSANNGLSKAEIARDIANESGDNADSLLRQVGRFSHLLE